MAVGIVQNPCINPNIRIVNPSSCLLYTKETESLKKGAFSLVGNLLRMFAHASPLYTS